MDRVSIFPTSPTLLHTSNHLSWNMEYVIASIPISWNMEYVIASIPISWNMEYVIASIPISWNMEYVIASIPISWNMEYVIASIPMLLATYILQQFLFKNVNRQNYFQLIWYTCLIRYSSSYLLFYTSH